MKRESEIEMGIQFIFFTNIDTYIDTFLSRIETYVSIFHFVMYTTGNKDFLFSIKSTKLKKIKLNYYFQVCL